MRHSLVRLALFCAGVVLIAHPAAAQLLSNASLKGAYNVRYLGVDASGVSDRPVSFSGTITFDGQSDANGNGGYTVTGQGAYFGATGGTLRFITSGQYGVLSNGLLFMTNPFDPANNNVFSSATTTVLYGGIGGNGGVTASSTDTNFADLFVAIPAATTAPTLSGKYNIAHMEFLGGNTNQTRQTFFSATASGGSFGDVTIKGNAQNVNSGTATTQTSPGVTYTMTANGTGTLVFPVPSGAITAANQLLSGNKILYATQDGNFFIAGGNTAYDFIVGAKALTGDPKAATTGLYFLSYFENLAAGSQNDAIYAVQGSNNILADGTIIGHERTNQDDPQFGPFSYDFSYDDRFAFAADGTEVSSFSSYAAGGGGNFIIGSGGGSNYQLIVYVKAPTLSGTGVFLNPQGIVNAANNVPFTAGVAPGEFVTLYGSGLATSTTSAQTLPFPTTLGGASVTVNGTAAPIYSASPGSLNIIVPYSAPSDGSFLDFKVTVGGTASNTATVYSGPTSPGVFTIPPGGIGTGAIEHSDFSVVNAANPAKVGETVQIFLTGLGAVTPAVKEGTAAPSSPLSTAATPNVYIDNIKANVRFAGLTPGSAGLYQVNVDIPSGVTAGSNVNIYVQTDAADNVQATIPIAK